LSLKDYAIVKNIEEHVTATVILQYLLFNMLRYLLGSLIKQKAREMHLSAIVFYVCFSIYLCLLSSEGSDRVFILYDPADSLIYIFGSV